MDTNRATQPASPWLAFRLDAGVLLSVLSLVAVFGAVVFVDPGLAVLGLAALAVAWTMFRWSDVCTLAFVCVVYTNAAVVLVKFHDVPHLVANLVAAPLLVPLFVQLVIRRQPVIFAPILPLALVYFFAQLVAAFGAIYPERAIASLRDSLLEGLVLYVLVTNLIRTPPMLRAVVWALVAAGTFMAAIPLYQHFTGTMDNPYGGFAQTNERGFRTGEVTVAGDVRQRRSCGSLGEQNRYAQVMMILIPLGLALVWGERNRGLRLLALAATGLIAAGSALAFSRGAAVGFAMMFVIAAVLGYLSRAQVRGLLLGGLLLLAAMPQYWTRLASLASLLPTSAQTSEEPDGAIQGRATEMLAAVYAYLDYPILGVGPGMFRFHSKEYSEDVGLKQLEGTRQAHCLYLDVAAESGTLGLCCFLAMIYVTWRNLAAARLATRRRAPRTSAIATGLLLALITYVTTGIFLHAAYVRYFWLLMALAASAHYVAYQGLAHESRDGEHDLNAHS